ncbi:MAG: hypothetical protein LAP87_03780 [Acidobacteriia bacterium]|nr:hypothetical protein [Terriglobia bacterium]
MLSCLCRLYDQDPKALSLGRFLRTIQTYRGYFSEDQSRQRLQDNPHIESLATDRILVDPGSLEKEINSVSATTDPLVSRLVKLRNGSVAHNDADLVRLGSLKSLGGLGHEEVQTLLDRAVRIASQYSRIYRASWSSTKVVGADDYEHVLSLLRKGLASVHAQNEREICRALAVRPKRPLLVTIGRNLGHISGYIVSSLGRCAR